MRFAVAPQLHGAGQLPLVAAGARALRVGRHQPDDCVIRWDGLSRGCDDVGARAALVRYNAAAWAALAAALPCSGLRLRCPDHHRGRRVGPWRCPLSRAGAWAALVRYDAAARAALAAASPSSGTCLGSACHHCSCRAGGCGIHLDHQEAASGVVGATRRGHLHDFLASRSTSSMMCGTRSRWFHGPGSKPLGSALHAPG